MDRVYYPQDNTMHRTLIALATLTLAGSAQAQSLLGYWPGDGSGADASGAGGDGAPYGDVSYAPGMLNDAFELDAGEWMDGPITPTDLESFSITGWWYLRDGTSHGSMFEAVNSDGAQPMRGHITAGTNRPILHMGPCGDLTAADGLALDQWYHMGFVYDGSERVIYVDGAEVARDSCVGITTADIVGYRIGTHALLYFIDGLIDEVRLYGDALSAEEVAEQAANPEFDAAPVLTVGGTCPGAGTVDVTGLTPGGSIQWLISGSAGADPVDDGPCTGAVSGLALPNTGPAFSDIDGDGELHFTPTLPAGACSKFLQGIDLDTCATTQAFDMSTL